MKRLIAIVLLVLMLGNIAFASTFTDLKSVPWAVQYIDRAQSLNIVTGYSDGTFKPDLAVGKYAAILTIYRMLDAQKLVLETDKTVLKNRYASIIEAKKVPKNWPQLEEAVAFALEYKIIAEKDLDSFMVGTVHQNITREQFSLYLGKALNLYLKKNTEALITVNFKDIKTIALENLKYINILVNTGVMAGDSSGNFYPKNSLSRAALAKVVCTGIDVLQSQVSVEKTIKATVKVLLPDTQRVVFYEIEDKTKSYIEVIDNSVVITVNGATASFASLIIDQPVTLTYLNGKLSKVAAETVTLETTTLTGEVLDIINTTKKAIFIKNDKDGTSKFYDVDPNAVITNATKPSDLATLKKQDYIVAQIQNNVIKSFDFKVKYRSLKGVVKDIIVDVVPKVIITVGGEDLTLTFAEKATITRNNAAKTIGSLVSGDQVSFDAVFDEIQKLTATGVVTKDAGTISKVAMGTKNELTVKTAVGVETVYEIDKNAVVYIDNKAASFLDLRVNYTVELKVEGTVVKEIKAITSIAKSNIIGVVEKVYLDLNVITVKVGTDIYNVYMTDATIKLSTDGSKVGANVFKAGQKVFVYGAIEDRIVRGDKVFIYEN